MHYKDYNLNPDERKHLGFMKKYRKRPHPRPKYPLTFDEKTDISRFYSRRKNSFALTSEKALMAMKGRGLGALPMAYVDPIELKEVGGFWGKSKYYKYDLLPLIHILEEINNKKIAEIRKEKWVERRRIQENIEREFSQAIKQTLSRGELERYKNIFIHPKLQELDNDILDDKYEEKKEMRRCQSHHVILMKLREHIHRTEVDFWFWWQNQINDLYTKKNLDDSMVVVSHKIDEYLQKIYNVFGESYTRMKWDYYKRTPHSLSAMWNNKDPYKHPSFKELDFPPIKVWERTVYMKDYTKLVDEGDLY